MENNHVSDRMSIEEELMEQVKLVRKKLHYTVNIFDWKHFLIPQLSLIGALAFSTFSLYRFSLVSYSIFLGCFSILALLYWVFQSLWRRQAAAQAQDIGLELCARVNTHASNKDLRQEGENLFREIEIHEALLNEQIKRIGVSVLIYMSLFFAWMIFTIGDLSPDISRYEFTILGNVFIAIAVIIAVYDIRKSKKK